MTPTGCPPGGLARGGCHAAEPPGAAVVDPVPTIVDVYLEASETTKQFLPGAPTAMSAYNGTIPGPMLGANVGDTLIVHFTNNLPDETFHWHGTEAPADPVPSAADPVGSASDVPRMTEPSPA